MTHCQTACQIHEDCNFFTFLKDEHVCKLHALDFTNRVCDIIHGLPTRTFQSCLDENKIPWANSSGNKISLWQISFKMIILLKWSIRFLNMFYILHINENSYRLGNYRINNDNR